MYFCHDLAGKAIEYKYLDGVSYVIGCIMITTDSSLAMYFPLILQAGNMLYCLLVEKALKIQNDGLQMSCEVVLMHLHLCQTSMNTKKDKQCTELKTLSR